MLIEITEQVRKQKEKENLYCTSYIYICFWKLVVQTKLMVVLLLVNKILISTIVNLNKNNKKIINNHIKTETINISCMCQPLLQNKNDNEILRL